MLDIFLIYSLTMYVFDVASDKTYWLFFFCVLSYTTRQKETSGKKINDATLHILNLHPLFVLLVLLLKYDDGFRCKLGE